MPTVEEAVRATAAQLVPDGTDEERQAAVEDVVLRSPGDQGRAAGSTSLAATLDILGQAGSVEDLQVCRRAGTATLLPALARKRQ